MLRAVRLICLLSLGLAFSAQVGCNKGDTATSSTATHDYDHDDGHAHGDHGHATDFGGGIEELEELSGKIGTAMAKGDADTAHDPLHEVGHVLEALPELAKKAGLSDEDQKAVNGAVATLMDSYGEVDAGMHGEEGKSWDDLKGDIEAAVKTLTAFEHGHDHGAHDHKDGDHE